MMLSERFVRRGTSFSIRWLGTSRFKAVAKFAFGLGATVEGLRAEARKAWFSEKWGRSFN